MPYIHWARRHFWRCLAVTLVAFLTPTVLNGFNGLLFSVWLPCALHGVAKVTLGALAAFAWLAIFLCGAIWFRFWCERSTRSPKKLSRPKLITLKAFVIAADTAKRKRVGVDF